MDRETAAELPISRWGVGEVTVGRRVIVRRRLSAAEAAASGKKVTDVIGHVVSLAPLRVRPQLRAGVPAETSVPAVEFATEDIVVIKALPDHPVRNSDIRAVEVATAKAFPGIAHVEEAGWLLRAGDGITERSNSALPISPSASTQPVPLEQIRCFYAAHELPVRIAIPDRIAKPAQALVANPQWQVGPDIVVMTRQLTEPLPDPDHPDSSITVDIADQPDKDWLDLYHFRGAALPEHALELLRQDIDGRMCFGRLCMPDPNQPDHRRTVAITRGTLTESDDGRVWLGFSAVEVAADMRRKGLGRLLGIQMLHWGASQGADASYLQVLAANVAGISLYRSLGFSEHHRHRYAELLEA